MLGCQISNALHPGPTDHPQWSDSNENYYNATEEAKEVVIYVYSIYNIQSVFFLILFTRYLHFWPETWL